jgi:hypothetical protein
MYVTEFGHIKLNTAVGKTGYKWKAVGEALLYESTNMSRICGSRSGEYEEFLSSRI